MACLKSIVKWARATQLFYAENKGAIGVDIKLEEKEGPGNSDFVECKVSNETLEGNIAKEQTMLVMALQDAKWLQRKAQELRNKNQMLNRTAKINALQIVWDGEIGKEDEGYNSGECRTNVILGSGEHHTQKSLRERRRKFWTKAFVIFSVERMVERGELHTRLHADCIKHGRVRSRPPLCVVESRHNSLLSFCKRHKAPRVVSEVELKQDPSKEMSWKKILGER